MARYGRGRGFTLIEVMVAVGAMAVIAAIGVTYMRANAERQQINAGVQQQAQEMAQLTRAAIEHAEANMASMQTALAPVAVSTFVSAARLPTGFANRNGVVGTTPFGATYLVRVGRTAANKPIAVVTEEGNPTQALLKRVGLTNATADIKSLQERIARAIHIDYKLIAGVMDPSTYTVQGNFTSFSQNIMPLMFGNGGATIARHRVTVIKGHPVLEPPSTQPNTPNGTVSDYDSCTFSVARRNPQTGYWENGTCAAPYVSVAQWGHCAVWQSSADPIVATPMGALTFEGRSRNPSSLTTHGGNCFVGDSGCYEGLTDTITDMDIYLNNAAMSTYGCSHDVYASRWNSPYLARRYLLNNVPTGLVDHLCCKPK